MHRHAFIPTHTSINPSSCRSTCLLQEHWKVGSCSCVTAHTHTHTDAIAPKSLSVFRRLKGKSEIYEAINPTRQGVDGGRDTGWIKESEREKRGGWGRDIYSHSHKNKVFSTAFLSFYLSSCFSVWRWRFAHHKQQQQSNSNMQNINGWVHIFDLEKINHNLFIFKTTRGLTHLMRETLRWIFLLFCPSIPCFHTHGFTAHHN